MAVYNTTYNYNQGNMNFGQALLYGAFGSLTGSMGGYGMGMNGSLFSMMGMGMGGYGCFGGYGMGCYSDSVVGTQMGLVASQYVMAGVCRAFDGRGGSQSESASSMIDNIKTSAGEYLKKLDKGTTLNNFNPSKKASEYKVVSELTDEISKQESELSTSKDSLDKLETELRKIGIDQAPTKEVVEEILKKECKETDPEKIREYIDQNYNTKFNELDEKFKAYENAKKDVEDKEKALKILKSEKETKEKEVQTAIDALKPLKEEYDKLKVKEKAQTEAKAYDDADGNWLNRASKSSVEEYNGGTCTKSQVRKAFNLFIEAKNNGKTDDAKNWANKLVLMHNSNPELFDNNFATAFNQVETWLEEN